MCGERLVGGCWRYKALREAWGASSLKGASMGV